MIVRLSYKGVVGFGVGWYNVVVFNRTFYKFVFRFLTVVSVTLALILVVGAMDA